MIKESKTANKEDQEPPSGCYPVLPLRDIVIFPHMIVPLFVGRDKSIAALESVIEDERRILLLAQRDASEEDPQPQDLYEVGVIGTILQILKLPDGTLKVLIEGGARTSVTQWMQNDPFLEAEIETIEDESAQDADLEALSRTVAGQFENYVKLNKKIPPEVIVSVTQLDEPDRLADTIAAHLSIKISEKQALLAIPNVKDRLEKIYSIIEAEMDILQVEKRVRVRVKKQMEKSQREYYLNEQMKAIQKEMAKSSDGAGGEIEELEKAIEKKPLSKEARQKANAELKKLKQMSPMASEATIVRNYLDWIISLPWSKRSRVRKDLKEASKILEEDHWGLDKVKERIMEYLAVQQRASKVKGPILCFAGPPGVGKTSLGKSIARATGREFVRMSLGGVRDESEIRGHRRTYVGALPGKIIQSMKRAGKANPLFLLDEIDKIGSDWRGDPASALLEVLDPEQNSTFQDHYLELDYDLSDVMFVCTANSISTIPWPLLDRMEVIQVSSYTEDEKLQIVRRHLLERQRKAAGLKKKEFEVTDGAIRGLIRHYTREAGVRNLERSIANLCRKSIKEILMKGKKKVRITPANLGKYAGVQRFKYREADEKDRIGVVNGLAYTEYGGNILAIEAVTMQGKDGKVSVTGNLRDVMKESITVAEMLIKSRAADFGVSYASLKSKQIHVHVPEGAVPKDGPSAGAAMVSAILSSLTNTPIHHDIAMTGEVNLRGKVTEIGGLKEKLLAAHRAGIKTVLIPKDNEKDLVELPTKLKKALEIIPVGTIEEVLMRVLVEMPKPISTTKGAKKTKISKISGKTAENNDKQAIRH